jgi:hypothetical protein
MPINTNGKRLAVVGSRTFNDKAMLKEFLDKNYDRIKIIVSGGAKGADTLATEWAAENGVPYLVFPALWYDRQTGLLNRGAGFKRNWDIVEHSDTVVAFYDGLSKGTANTISIAKQLNKPLIIIPFQPVTQDVESSSASETPTTPQSAA